MKKTEKKRKLSKAEQRRQARFDRISANMESQGYVRKDLTINILAANIFAILLLIPLAVIGALLFHLAHEGEMLQSFNPLTFLVAFLVLVVAHELIHGASWGIFTPNHFRDVEFGIMMSSLTPYCACLQPLGKAQYIFGALMPLIALGIGPMIVGIITGNSTLLAIGIVMADAAAGDIMVVHKILTYRSNADEIVYMDHPTEAGGVIFER